MRTHKRGRTAVCRLGIVLLVGFWLSLHTPEWSSSVALAWTPAADEPQQADVISGTVAAINSTLVDFQLPGTQPGGLPTALAESSTCTGCHTDHIRDSFKGSMMGNSMRDPLFRAALVIANKDTGYGGELCIRCHSPNAWLNNRSATPSDPTSTDGRLLLAEDLDGIRCTACHRMVPPFAISGEAPGDATERNVLTGPFLLGSGALIVDRNDVRRGPFDIGAAPHAVAQSSFLRSAEICATCHDIDNPLLTFDSISGEFKLNALNTAVSADDRLFPLDRSYSEWKASAFAAGGVSGLDYPGLKRSTGTANGPITVCQDCHMPMVSSKIANDNTAPVRTVGAHEWVGANTTWQDGIVQVWQNVGADTRFDATQTTNSKARGVDLLSRAADLDVAVVDGQLQVKVTNNTGHKLPTGYAEGRRIWIEIYQLRGSTPVFTSGLMSGVVGPLIKDPYLTSYEAHMGLTDDHALAIGRPELAGESYHIMLNNKVFEDTRIPPRGFTNAAFVARDMEPVGATYADGQYWDITTYPIHPEATEISVRLMYQTASTEYLDFLASEANFNMNDPVRGPTNWGQIIADLRGANIGKPQVMTSAHLFFPREFVATGGNDSGACTDSANPCKTIGYALSQASPGTEIRVAAGTYPEQIQVSQQVLLTGGFTLTNWITPTWQTYLTILDGQQAYRPLTINADNVHVNGFIVRNGNANTSGNKGGGIYIGAVNTVDRATLVNLRLENNVASNIDGGDGGGLFAEIGNTFNITTELTLRSVTVVSNTATTGSLGATGGGMRIYAAGNSPLLVNMTNVTVQGNTAGNDFSSAGGGIALSLNGGKATISQSRILGNHAAQIKTFLGGPSQAGGIYLTSGRLLLENVLIAGNDGERGDAMWIGVAGGAGANVEMNYVTIANNYRVAGDAGPALHVTGGLFSFNIDNTLISGNPVAFEAEGDAQPRSVNLGSVLIADDVTTVVSGTITQNGVPLRGAAGYENANAGDFHLTAASAAVDQGNDRPPSVDLDGISRPRGAASDIGAYEFTPSNFANQTITFNPLPNKVVTNPPFQLSATASSGLPVTFASLTSGACTVSGAVVTLVAPGTCSIRATQAGNGSFNAATPVTQSFQVLPEGSLIEESVYLPLLAR